MRGPKRNSSLEETNRFVYISAEICAPHDRLNANRSQSPHGYGSNFIRSGSGRFGYGGTGAGYSTPATSPAQPPTGHQQMNNLDSLESYDSGVGGFGEPCVVAFLEGDGFDRCGDFGANDNGATSFVRTSLARM